ncbi:MAG TPA: glucoamylase family protein, partial [bacterium]|nr:glucoamylase family protein [bacterium]
MWISKHYKIGAAALVSLFLFFPFSVFSYAPSAEEAARLAQIEEESIQYILLSKIEKDSVQYFIRLSDKVTGLTRDSSQPGSPASIAATGFALAAVAIGQSRQWIPRDQAYRQIDKTLNTLLHKAEQKNGFFYHFLDPRSGKRVWSSEASSIDTAILVAGALLAVQYFPGTPAEKMARAVYERIHWKWMMNDSSFLCMGWKPESGFLPYYWDSYNELVIMEALALGSPTHPIPKEAWSAWLRPEEEYRGKNIVFSSSGSLFTYQYSHAFIDFRELDDRGINYFDNSV